MPEPVGASRATRVGLWLITGSVHLLGRLRIPIAAIVGIVWYLKQPESIRLRAARNHQRLAPRLTNRQALRRARASYLEYVRMIFDAIWADRLSAARVRDVLAIEGAEHVASGSGVLVTSHFGNWDMGASGGMALGLRISSVMAPIGFPALTAMVALSRARKQFELHAPERAARALIRGLRHGRWVALMADVPEAGPTVVVPFCGGRVRMSAVPARLAAATGTPLVPTACWREGRRWRLRIHPPIAVARDDDETEVMAHVAAVLEPEIRRHPRQWYPFHEVYEDVA
jgi:lauroyl/myristoyl acyltransferase